MNSEMKSKKTRSPNFPAISLEKGLSLAQILLEKYARHPVPIEIALTALGYKSLKSSSGLQATAALNAYGLTEVEGEGKGKKIAVSDLAFKILADKRAISTERDAAIKEAALNPPIFHKIIERYPDGLPADDVLGYELVFTYKFNEGSVRDFINAFRQTLGYAKIYEPGIIGEEYTPSESLIREPKGDKPMTTHPYTAGTRPHTQIVRPTGTPAPEEEYEIARFFLGDNINIRLLASAPITKFTKKTIKKLGKYLELYEAELRDDGSSIEKPTEKAESDG
jgi:hypothetical protein